VLVDGKPDATTPGDPQQHPGITAFFSQEKSCFNMPPPWRALTAAVVFNPAVGVAFTSCRGFLCRGALDFPSSAGRYRHGERERQGHNFAGLCLGDRSIGAAAWVKSLAYLLVGVSVAVVVMGLGGLIFQLSFAATQHRCWWAHACKSGGGVLFGLFYWGCAALTRIRRCRGVSLLGFSLGPCCSPGFIYPLRQYSPPLFAGVGP